MLRAVVRWQRRVTRERDCERGCERDGGEMFGRLCDAKSKVEAEKGEKNILNRYIDQKDLRKKLESKERKWSQE